MTTCAGVIPTPMTKPCGPPAAPPALMNFLERMPDGLDTDMGQGGVNVSGGQKQRLCIARTLLKHPKVLIF